MNRRFCENFTELPLEIYDIGKDLYRNFTTCQALNFATIDKIIGIKTNGS
jgi:hypothetical protein